MLVKCRVPFSGCVEAWKLFGGDVWGMYRFGLAKVK